MRALKIAGAAIGAVIVVIALLAVIGIPSGFMTTAIQDRVERETGYRLAINGGAKIGLWPSLNVTLNELCEFTLAPVVAGIYTLTLRLDDVELEIPELLVGESKA